MGWQFTKVLGPRNIGDFMTDEKLEKLAASLCARVTFTKDFESGVNYILTELRTLQTHIDRLEKERDIYKKALEFYADNDICIPPSDWNSFKMGGRPEAEDYEGCSDIAITALSDCKEIVEGK